MIKKFIKGSSTNPEGVIKALEKLGGRNEHNLTGRMSNNYYFIDDKGVIDAIAPSDTAFCILTECFEEIQPMDPEPVDPKPVPKVITNLDVAKWYFHMLREGHAVQFMNRTGYIHFGPLPYLYDDGKTTLEKVRIDFGEWMTIEEAGIDKYEIYCSEEQTEKAYKLGAPLNRVYKQDGTHKIWYTLPYNDPNWQDCDAYYIPTVEQMVEWLESEMGIELDVYRVFDHVLERTIKEFEWSFRVGEFHDSCNTEFKSRKEATLDAIDHALDYLISKKN